MIVHNHSTDDMRGYTCADTKIYTTVKPGTTAEDNFCAFFRYPVDIFTVYPTQAKQILIDSSLVLIFKPNHLNIYNRLAYPAFPTRGERLTTHILPPQVRIHNNTNNYLFIRTLNKYVINPGESSIEWTRNLCILEPGQYNHQARVFSIYDLSKEEGDSQLHIDGYNLFVSPK